MNFKVNNESIVTAFKEFIPIMVFILLIDYGYHMLDHYKINHPYKLVCIEGHEYIQITNSYQGFMSPSYDDNGLPKKCKIK